MTARVGQAKPSDELRAVLERVASREVDVPMALAAISRWIVEIVGATDGLDKREVLRAAGNAEVVAVRTELGAVAAQRDAFKSALGHVAELGERCEECEPTEAPFATHVTAHTLSGIPIFLCPEHAEEARQAHRKAESKGCGDQPEVEEHEQETAVRIALEALGIKVGVAIGVAENGGDRG